MLKKMRLKSELKRAFYKAELYQSYTNGGGKKTLIYPKIHDVKIDANETQFVFTLRNGMDPKEVINKQYVFQQFFGLKLEIDGDVKRFCITVFSKGLPSVIKYNYAEILPLIEGFTMPIVCGKDQQGEWRVYDAVNAPNALIYGEPGAGKSTMLHNILATLIQYYSPKELELYLGDFKMSEFPAYEDVEHVKSLCFLPKELNPTLKHLKRELTKRGQLLKKYKVRHINKVPDVERPPLVVIAIDEFVMIKDDDIMTDLLQIASLGRAYGIYVILSLQRPSHSILSTDVRAVLSVRMGFRTVDKRNAQMGETPGSEKISKSEPGKFLLNHDDLTELQAPYISEDHAERILDKYKVSNWKNHSFTRKDFVKGDYIDAEYTVVEEEEKETDPLDDLSEENFLGVLKSDSNSEG
jgi:S-DNA-T family DNA segregation ATPase FtsK/SpoIIIE